MSIQSAMSPEKVEALQESYSAEIGTFEAMKAGLALAAKALIDYKQKMLQEMTEAKLPIKEVELGKVYVNRCVYIVQRIFNDTEARRLQAVGAADAMKRVVESAKRVYDEENDKLKRFQEFSSSDKDPLQRPPGYPPEPIEKSPSPKKRKRAI